MIVGWRGTAWASPISSAAGTPEMVGFCMRQQLLPQHRGGLQAERALALQPGSVAVANRIAVGQQSDLQSADGSAYLDGRRAEGLEANSLAADPQFVDPAHGDYRLKPGSPAWKLGFLPVDLGRIGRERRLRWGRRVGQAECGSTVRLRGTPDCAVL